MHAVFPDGTVVSLPIPSRARPSLQALVHNDVDHCEVAADLSGGKVTHTTSVQLDPDLHHGCITRQEVGVRPSVGAAHNHLAKHEVG